MTTLTVPIAQVKALVQVVSSLRRHLQIQSLEGRVATRGRFLVFKHSLEINVALYVRDIRAVLERVRVGSGGL